VGLGHARLSIIDLTTGDQPIANEDERLRIVVNGEFYGYETIQKELERAGHKLRTRSDSEIVLHLYEDLGAHCLHRLRGEFAIVLWDSINRTIFAARDRFGIKPLFSNAIIKGQHLLRSGFSCQVHPALSGKRELPRIAASADRIGIFSPACRSWTELNLEGN
jgi:asparagine synthetase B (glutamine-hydrolysing)